MRPRDAINVEAKYANAWTIVSKQCSKRMLHCSTQTNSTHHGSISAAYAHRQQLPEPPKQSQHRENTLCCHGHGPKQWQTIIRVHEEVGSMHKAPCTRLRHILTMSIDKHWPTVFAKMCCFGQWHDAFTRLQLLRLCTGAVPQVPAAVEAAAAVKVAVQENNNKRRNERTHYKSTQNVNVYMPSVQSMHHKVCT